MTRIRPMTSVLAAAGLVLATQASAQGASGGYLGKNLVDLSRGIPGQTMADQRPTTDQQGGLAEREMGTLPPERRQGNVVYRTGGVGDPEDQAFRAARSQYPLAIEFTGRGQPNLPYNEHLANVEVSIIDQGGRELLRTVADGPWLLAKVPPGRYTVHARFQGYTQTRQAHVPGSGNRLIVFSWDNVG